MRFLLLSKTKAAQERLFFFLPYKLRIADSGGKTANFPGVEVLTYHGLLLWISGGNLTKTGHRDSERRTRVARDGDGEGRWAGAGSEELGAEAG
jgi:hypothetical protein